jgi:hypothetical protein
LEKHLRDHNWAAFTEVYNGPDNRDEYAKRIARWYKHFKQQEKEQRGQNQGQLAGAP